MKKAVEAVRSPIARAKSVIKSWGRLWQEKIMKPDVLHNCSIFTGRVSTIPHFPLVDHQTRAGASPR